MTDSDVIPLLKIRRVRKIEAELGVGFGAGLLVGDDGVEIWVDNHVKVPDQETVASHDLVKTVGDAHYSRNADALGQHTDLTVKVFLSDDDSDNVAEINQRGV